MKYKTYKELKAAYDTGELDRDEHPLFLDNDSSYVIVEGEIVFQGNGYEDIKILAELAGFPAEWV